MKDRRSETSRRNLAGHVPAPLDGGESAIVAVRLPKRILEKLDVARGEQTRSAFLRDLLTRNL